MKKAEWQRYQKQAEHTLTSARRDFEAEDCDWACFKAHQAAELILKGWLRSSERFVTGHSVVKLLADIQQQTTISEEVRKCARELDKVYIPSRYPDAYSSGAPMEFFDRQNALESLNCAEKIFALVKYLVSNAE